MLSTTHTVLKSVSQVTYDNLYPAPCLVSRTIFGSLVPAMCNRTSWAQVQSAWVATKPL